jgi:hypothetical protein
MQVRETSTHKASGFSSDFFHTLIKQRPFFGAHINAPMISLNSRLYSFPEYEAG